MRFGARDYDAVTGRWTAKAPILFDGGGFTGASMIAVFSASSTLLAESEPFRVADARLSDAPAFNSAPTWNGNLPTNLVEDFPVTAQGTA